jgi:pimeloyl-ACP methyl ester carboxylesterase
MADFVLLHGTTQSPLGWERLVVALRQRGHAAHAVDLPTDAPGLLAEDYARVIRGQVPGEVVAPIVVAHSGSGLLLPAARGLAARHQVWPAAVVPDRHGGRSLLDEVRTGPTAIFNAEWLGQNPVDDPGLATYFLFHNCDLATLRWALTTLRLFNPQAAYQEVPRPEAWPAIPTTCVVATEDRTIRPDWLRRVARERLGVQPLEVPGGHCPHVSRPDLMADLLDRAASG